jgi:hypothetical protein
MRSPGNHSVRFQARNYGMETGNEPESNVGNHWRPTTCEETAWKRKPSFRNPLVSMRAHTLCQHALSPLNGTRRSQNANYKTMIAVNSSAIRAVAYDGFTLTIMFHSGGVYDHPGVPYSVYRGLMQAHSMGAYYNQNIRGRYR